MKITRWRWLPCAGLASGALAQALLIVAVVPDRVGTSGLASEQRPAANGVDERAAAPGRPGSPYSRSASGVTRARTAPGVDDGVVGSIFAPPPMELPIAPPDPAPLPPDPALSPPPAAPPVPVGTPSIFSLPEPPPAPAPVEDSHAGQAPFGADAAPSD